MTFPGGRVDHEDRTPSDIYFLFLMHTIRALTLLTHRHSFPHLQSVYHYSTDDVGSNSRAFFALYISYVN